MSRVGRGHSWGSRGSLFKLCGKNTRGEVVENLMSWDCWLLYFSLLGHNEGYGIGKPSWSSVEPGLGVAPVPLESAARTLLFIWKWWRRVPRWAFLRSLEMNAHSNMFLASCLVLLNKALFPNSSIDFFHMWHGELGKQWPLRTGRNFKENSPWQRGMWTIPCPPGPNNDDQRELLLLTMPIFNDLFLPNTDKIEVECLPPNYKSPVIPT